MALGGGSGVGGTGGMSAMSAMGGQPSAGAGGGTSTDCGDSSTRPIVIVDADVSTSRTWSCDKVYLLNRPIRVIGTTNVLTVLSIEPGTLIQGKKGTLGVTPAGALIVSRTARLIANGTAEHPIVFTSSALAGTRLAGDWGGVVLLGNATNNVGETNIAGVSASPATVYGAPINAGDPAWNCGSLRYVRIEFPGFMLTGGTGLRGLTLGSCGFDTTVDNVQIHRGAGDGVGIFGGMPDLKHLVITGARGNSVDWDQGYSGRMQFLAAQQYPGGADHGIQAGNNTNTPAAVPISDPRIYNATLLGTNLTAQASSTVGLKFKSGTHGTLRNTIVMGFDLGVLDIEGTQSSAAAQAGLLSVRNSIFVGVPGKIFPTGIDDAADNSLDEATFFLNVAFKNRKYNDGPAAATAMLLQDPFNRLQPGWIPILTSPASTLAETPSDPSVDQGAGGAGGLGNSAGGTGGAGGAAGAGNVSIPRPAFFDTAATYVGAFEPGGGSDWAANWTAFPEN